MFDGGFGGNCYLLRMCEHREVKLQMGAGCLYRELIWG